MKRVSYNAIITKQNAEIGKLREDRKRTSEKLKPILSTLDEVGEFGGGPTDFFEERQTLRGLIHDLEGGAA